MNVASIASRTLSSSEGGVDGAVNGITLLRLLLLDESEVSSKRRRSTLVGILLRPRLAALDIRDANVDLTGPLSFSMSNERDRDGGEGSDVGCCACCVVEGGLLL